MKNSIYTSGEYLNNTSTWHAEDSPWKAKQIAKIIQENELVFKTIVEVGCGAGAILEQLSLNLDDDIKLVGCDISAQAIELASKIKNDNISFQVKDLLSDDNEEQYDVLLMIDVFEHVPDYLGFISRCKDKAKYKIFHIPLDLHVSSVLRNTFIKDRYTVGHIHYFTAESALATLKDSGLKIIDYDYTNVALDLFKVHPSFKKAIANIPRWLIAKYSTSLSSRIMGGYSLLVLAE